MFQHSTFESRLVATAGILLLIVLPVPGVCQIESTQAEESSEAIEEIVVRGHKTLINLKHEMYEAEEALYGIFNSLNSDDDYDIYCYEEAPTGSNLKQRVCRTQKLGKILAEQTQIMMRGEPYVFPADEINEMNERMLAEMTKMTSEHPEYFNALIKFTEAKQTLESEHKRRCEGRFLICRQE